MDENELHEVKPYPGSLAEDCEAVAPEPQETLASLFSSFNEIFGRPHGQTNN
jgi:hypothetical protein